MILDTLADTDRPIAADVEPVPQEPLTSALAERLHVLHNAVRLSRNRVDEQRRRLEELRRGVAEYAELMERLNLQAQRIEQEGEAALTPPAAQAAAEPAPVEAVESVESVEAAPAEPSLPATWALNADPELVMLAAPKDMRLSVGWLEEAVVVPTRPRAKWSRALPYAALALVGLGLGLEGLHHPAQARIPASLSALPVPPPPVLSMEEQAASEEAANGDVLALVYSYVPPGGRQNVHDLLAPDLESAIGGSPWVIARLDDKTTLVSFHPDGEPEEGAPIYEFAVDVAAQTVTASPETIRNLRGGVAAAR